MNGTRKVIVGIFVAVCLTLFGVGLFLIGNSNQLFAESFTAYADFSKITGIQNGGKVRVAGMDAGAVTKIDVPQRPEDKFRVYFRIIEKLHPIVRQDSVASIQTDGLLGNTFVLIDAGSSSAEFAKDNSLIRSTEPFDWSDLMEQVSSTVKQVNGILEGIKDQLTSTLKQVETTVKSADTMIKGTTPQVNAILASADKIGANLREIIDGVQQGQGTVGALFKDQTLYDSVKRSVDKTEAVVENLRETSASATKIVKKVEESEIVPKVQQAVENLQRITVQVKAAVDKFQSSSSDGGVGETLQRTLADAHEAMSDLSDDTEALKRNFLFRGFFKDRGFYDLTSLTTPEYKSSSFGKGFKQHRVWLEAADLFGEDPKGELILTVDGKFRLDEAMTEILKFPRNGPLVVEGFASEGSASQQFLLGRRRGDRVLSYIVDRFQLRPAYGAVVPIGLEPAGKGATGGSKEGVAIVSFYKK